MKTLRGCAAFLFVLGAIGMSAGPAPALTAPAGFDHRGPNLTGQYSGTVSDSSLGSGAATANFAGGDGTLGGWFGFTFGSATYSNPAVAWTDRDGVRGTFVATIGSTACSFDFRASYDPSGFTLSGAYRAVGRACSGESGSFSLTQQCYYKIERGVRRDNGLGHC
jgi:hypothetical protein